MTLKTYNNYRKMIPENDLSLVGKRYYIHIAFSHLYRKKYGEILNLQNI